MVNEMAMQDDIPFGALLVVVLGCCAAVGYSLMSVRRMLVIQDHLIEAVGQMVQRQGVIEQMTGLLNWPRQEPDDVGLARPRQRWAARAARRPTAGAERDGLRAVAGPRTASYPLAAAGGAEPLCAGRSTAWRGCAMRSATRPFVSSSDCSGTSCSL